MKAAQKCAACRGELKSYYASFCEAHMKQAAVAESRELARVLESARVLVRSLELAQEAEPLTADRRALMRRVVTAMVSVQHDDFDVWTHAQDEVGGPSKADERKADRRAKAKDRDRAIDDDGVRRGIFMPFREEISQ